MSTPQPPQGCELVIQELQPDGSVIWMPSVPVDCFSSLLYWNPWQGAWEKPKYICKGCDAILCFNPEHVEPTDEKPLSR